MPISSNNYTSPTWVNGGPPPIDASELQAITDTLQNSQTIRGFGPPTGQTSGIVGQRYADLRTTPPTIYRLADNSYTNIWVLDNDFQYAYVQYDASLAWEQGVIAESGGNSDSEIRIRTPSNRYFTPIRSNDSYLTIAVSNPELEVKIQEYDGTPATSVSATGRYSAYRGGTWIYKITTTYHYRLCARKVNGGEITPEDIGENDIAVFWYGATDNSLTMINKAADAKATGDAIYRTEEFLVADMRKTSFYGSSYNIVPGYYDGGVAKASPSGSYARTEYLFTGIGTRNAVLLDSDTYQYNVTYYDSTGATDGTGYIGTSGYGKGLKLIPEYAARIGLTFVRNDGAPMTTADYDDIKEALYAYSPTDITLTSSGIPADAKQTGEIRSFALAETKKRLFGDYFTAAYSIVPGYYDGGVAKASPSGSYARTEYLYNGIGTRNAVLMDNDTYLYNVTYYDSTGATDGTGYIGTSGYNADLTIFPEYAARIGLTFVRNDGAPMTTADYDYIREELFAYSPTDIVLTSPGIPADARKTGEMFAALSYLNTDSVDLIWNQGSISEPTGTNIEPAATNRIRSFGYSMLDSLRGFICYVPEDYSLGFRRYKRNEAVTYIGYEGYRSGPFVIDNGDNNGANAYRFVLRKNDQTDLTPSDVPAGLKIIPIFRQPWEKEACGYSKPTVTTKRNNPDLVADFLAVAETYYTHRNDKTGNVYDMVYGYNTCIQTTEYTNQIDCSTFVGLVLRGWSYEQTQYYTHESGTTYPANPEKSWAVNPADYKYIGNLFVEGTGEANTNPSSVRMASQQGQWMIDQGQRVPMDGRMVNVEPGDIVFWANKTANNNPTDPNRFMTIGHVAICCGKRPTTEDDPWPASLYPYAHTIIEVHGGTPVVNKRYLEVGWDDEDEGVITHSGVNYAVLVCRPDLGALS